MDKLSAWHWILLLLLLRGLLALIPIQGVHDLYGLIVTSGVVILVWSKLDRQESLLRPFVFGLWLYWLGYVADYFDGILDDKDDWGYIADTADDLLFAIGFFLIGLAFLKVMNHRTSLINKLNFENERGQAMQLALHNQAYSDELTGLGNRRALFEYLDQQIQAGQRGTLLYIDVNNFKPVNDRFGHDVGDQVLKRCAVQIQTEGTKAFRLGGDEFVVILQAQDPKLWAFELSKHAKLLAQDYGVTFSIGMASFAPDSPRTPDELLTEADQQMYREKVAGKKRQKHSINKN